MPSPDRYRLAGDEGMTSFQIRSHETATRDGNDLQLSTIDKKYNMVFDSDALQT